MTQLIEKRRNNAGKDAINENTTQFQWETTQLLKSRRSDSPQVPQYSSNISLFPIQNLSSLV
jgi:hypothetical protein